MRWLLLTAGRGPAECQVAVQGLAGQLIAEAREAGVEAAIVSTEPGEHGPLSALLSLRGDGAAALCSSWEGTLQWICPSPLRKGWGRKNWFVAASLLAPPEPASPLRRGEVRFEPMKAKGPGGQHVNKTESAVRATHLPTGLSCVAREERSQHRNKELALARLAQTIAGRGAQAEADARRDACTRHDALERGNAVRVYSGPEFRLVGAASNRGVSRDPA